MGRANNNRKVPRHRIISYSGETLVNERVLFFVKVIVLFGFTFALGTDFFIDADRADQRDDGDNNHQRGNEGKRNVQKGRESAMLGKYRERDNDEGNGGGHDE